MAACLERNSVYRTRVARASCWYLVRRDFYGEILCWSCRVTAEELYYRNGVPLLTQWGCDGQSAKGPGLCSVMPTKTSAQIKGRSLKHNGDGGND